MDSLDYQDFHFTDQEAHSDGTAPESTQGNRPFLTFTHSAHSQEAFSSLDGQIDPHHELLEGCFDAFDREVLASELGSTSDQLTGYADQRLPWKQGSIYTSNSARRISASRDHQSRTTSDKFSKKDWSPSTVNDTRQSSFCPSVTGTLNRHDTLSGGNHTVGITRSGASKNQQHRPVSQLLASSHAPPIVQGIPLVSTHMLPDRFRSIFPFPNFNAVQSKCFKAVYNSNDNVVMSSPTGSGKTAILELAICHLIGSSETDQYKIVYQAPTKSLCAERQRDWAAKFGRLNIKCAELTGDTEQANLYNVQNASIIITTPEKWDSITRKWKDHRKLVEMIRLFLIDEVHILKDTRGATLEAVVSRMKTVGSNVRFVALSATVPNAEDIATWLGKNSSNSSQPAYLETFGEGFRPVKLEKFVYGYSGYNNDFAFDKACDSKLLDIIFRHSGGKPLMIFCCTRNSAAATAKSLSQAWSHQYPRVGCWPRPSVRLDVIDKSLQECVCSGVAFHHAGMDPRDRNAIEKAYLKRQISVICCTSTLAVGVNLPCHMVIIKNTVTWQGTGTREYADIEVMQMLGRAGRPQFDDSAVAVVMTRKEKQQHYENMVSGKEILESCLHLNLIDHLNAEIGLGSITDISSAMQWLSGTFLSVRLKKNPCYYNMEGGDSDVKVEEICKRDLDLLEQQDLIVSQPTLKATEFGEAMARYYIKYDTMKIILSLGERAKLSELLFAVAQANEFREIRLKHTEKSLYKEFNKSIGINFPIKIDVALTAHKVSLIIQAELGGVDYPSGETLQKHKLQFQMDKGVIFTHLPRLIRCIVDCSLHKKDSVSTRNALELARSFGARVWDNSPLQLKQIPNLGNVAVRKLVNAGIRSLEMLEEIEASRIDMLLSRNAPFGQKIIICVQQMPKLRVSLCILGKVIKAGEPVKVNIKAEIGFLNEIVPTKWLEKPVYVCFLAETSDGSLIEFRKISARNISTGQDVFFTADLKTSEQFITCYAMCDDIAGSMCSANLKPGLPSSVFPEKRQTLDKGVTKPCLRDRSTLKKPLKHGDIRSAKDYFQESRDEYGDDELDDDTMNEAVVDESFKNIEEFEEELEARKRQTYVKKATASKRRGTLWTTNDTTDSPEPNRLENGKFPCNHTCKDKTKCRHYCCRNGTENPPKTSRKQSINQSTKRKLDNSSSPAKVQSKLVVLPGRKPTQQCYSKGEEIESVDLAGPDPTAKTTQMPSALENLKRLHTSVGRSPVMQSIGKTSFTTYTKPPVGLFEPAHGRNGGNTVQSTCSEDSFEATTMAEDHIEDRIATLESPSNSKRWSGSFASEENYGDEDMEDSMVGLADSLALSEDVSRSKDGITTTKDGELLQSTYSSSIPQEVTSLQQPESSKGAHSLLDASIATPLSLQESSAASLCSPPRQILTPLSTKLPSEKFVPDDAVDLSSSSLENCFAPRKRLRFEEDEQLPLEELVQGRTGTIVRSNVSQVSKEKPVSSDMEDIDPEIMAEFADIIDFY